VENCGNAKRLLLRDGSADELQGKKRRVGVLRFCDLLTTDSKHLLWSVNVNNDIGQSRASAEKFPGRMGNGKKTEK